MDSRKPSTRARISTSCELSVSPTNSATFGTSVAVTVMTTAGTAWAFEAGAAASRPQPASAIAQKTIVRNFGAIRRSSVAADDERAAAGGGSIAGLCRSTSPVECFLEPEERHQRVARTEPLRVQAAQLGNRVGLARVGRRRQVELLLRDRRARHVIATLEFLEVATGLADNGLWYARESRDLESVALVGGPFLHRVQEYERIAVLGRVEMHVLAGRQFLGEGGQLEVVGGEERVGTDLAADVSCTGPGERQAVVGAGAAADLVHQHEAVARCIVENVRGFGHL